MSGIASSIELTEEALTQVMGGCEGYEDDDLIEVFELDSDFADEFDCGGASDTGVCWIA
ncbi:MAG: hypothetical protein U0235_30195 [Polyangiaceae bacterium]